ncbi:MAG TPA: SIMPL domain-containing protein [Gaiellaceae bacterium]|nr:SIMPL domain-containing protein [Gaiellaceae bacterium]
MKTLLAAIAVSAVALAGGADAATAPSSASTNTVTVSGTGTVTAVPDQASFDFSVQTKAATATAALAKNGADVRAVIAAVEGAGVAESDIQTAQVSLEPVTSSDGTTIVAFSASDTISVTSLTVAKAGSVVDAAVGAGATSVDGPNLTVSSQDALYAQALKAAVAQAKTKAQALADAASETLGAVVTIDEGGGSVPVPFAQSAAASVGGTPIQAGTQEVQATVTVTFAMS